MSIPIYEYLKGKGKVRVLMYQGNDRFFVLSERDERIFVHRNRLDFIKEKKDETQV
jgi:hypothetical protein